MSQVLQNTRQQEDDKSRFFSESSGNGAGHAQAAANSLSIHSIGSFHRPEESKQAAAEMMDDAQQLTGSAISRKIEAKRAANRFKLANSQRK